MWKGEYFPNWTTRGVIPPQWMHGRNVFNTPHLGCITRTDAVQEISAGLWSPACSVGPSAAGVRVGDPWGGHCQGAHMGPIFGAGKQLSRRPRRTRALPWEAAAWCWQEFCWVLLNQGQGVGGLYIESNISQLETYYLALLTQGHCKSLVIFFFPTRLLAAVVCTPLHIAQCEGS